MKFFKPEDFPTSFKNNDMPSWSLTPNSIAEIANDKLDKFGKIIYGNFNVNNHDEITHKDRDPMHKALLVNIEEVERCKHTFDKVKDNIVYAGNIILTHNFVCECGKAVKPLLFEEM